MAMNTWGIRDGRELARCCRDMVKTGGEENELEQSTIMHIMKAKTKPFMYAGLNFL